MTESPLLTDLDLPRPLVERLQAQGFACVGDLQHLSTKEICRRFGGYGMNRLFYALGREPPGIRKRNR